MLGLALAVEKACLNVASPSDFIFGTYLMYCTLRQSLVDTAVTDFYR